ncbi:MAG: hypothetical protein ACKO0Z_12930 [Betaproteobacteria bacterium]
MPLDKSKIVLTFKHPRITRDAQELEGRRYFQGVTPHVLHVGINPLLPLPVVETAERGDVVWLWALSMVTVDKRKAKVGGAAQITLFCKAAAKYGATIIEGSTGRASENKRQWAAAVDDAHKIITWGGKRLPKTGAKPGRKETPWPSDEVEAAARRLWRSKNIESDAAAIRAAKEQWPEVTDRMMRRLGKSGRNN